MNIVKAGDKIKKRYKFISKDKKETIEAGFSDIEIPVSEHTLKHPPVVKVKLISAKIRTKHDNGKITQGKFLLITSLSDKEYPKAEFCKLVLDAYRLRWKIEEVHRHVKTDFHWEDIQLLKFNRLQAMNTLLWFVIGFIYRLDYMKYKFAEIFTSDMLEKKNNLSVLEKFIYYRITKVVIKCFTKVKTYKKIKKLKKLLPEEPTLFPDF